MYYYTDYSVFNIISIIIMVHVVLSVTMPYHTYISLQGSSMDESLLDCHDAGSTQLESLLRKGKRKQVSLLQQAKSKRPRSASSQGSENIVMVCNMMECAKQLDIIILFCISHFTLGPCM